MKQTLGTVAVGPIVGVAIPTGVMMYAATMFSMLTVAVLSRNVRMIPMTINGADPAAARNDMAIALLNARCEYILFVDCDMVFPPDALNRLLSHDLDIVGCDYRRRAPPFQKIGTFLPHMVQAEDGLVERSMLGLGFFLVKRRVFEKVECPWFQRIYENKCFLTEDLYFCAQAMKAGFKIWCDMDLTKQVDHMGQQPVPWVIPNEVTK
jgi:cellulose synthase/poly-beta-1,6-N-acetylglucosamine synthase-like glycosyltransferase